MKHARERETEIEREKKTSAKKSIGRFSAGISGRPMLTRCLRQLHREFYYWLHGSHPCWRLSNGIVHVHSQRKSMQFLHIVCVSTVLKWWMHCRAKRDRCAGIRRERPTWANLRRVQCCYEKTRSKQQLSIGIADRFEKWLDRCGKEKSSVVFNLSQKKSILIHDFTRLINMRKWSPFSGGVVSRSIIL